MTFIHTRRCVAVVQEQNDHDLQMMNREKGKKRKEKNQKSTINRISETVPKQEKSRNFWLCVESQLDVVQLILPMFFF